MTYANIASETLAETIHAMRDTKARPIFAKKRQANRLIAAVVAVTMLAASAMPSHADKRGDDIAKILGAAIVLGLIVNGVNKNKAHAAPVPAPAPQPIRLPRVPAICAIKIDSNDGDTVTVYPEKCLRREGFDYRLPNCARSVRIYGVPDRIYSATCLRDAGFRLEH